ncbi:hypothetical protein H6G80_35640 [Nostoc sp. FACHB-87]|uniref:hypothetical protein n=1 Tax=Nostocales TaxID=1161 RepID=UPI001681D859|nr:MULTISPECIES: hypothetical protein [Nostocales]MBD2459349.1 hypothetical protein [Nostoc sp. FACHB-87]MBD2480345.1 hypothetical protein [Anabaena sp. FACHB-83]MBD2492661.1 hypothetical protein [Aulosira sp. FACHB-615]
MTNQIFVVVADGSQREWTEAEKHLISNNPELIDQLQGWLENSLSDGCWHPQNYQFLQRLINPLKIELFCLFQDEELDEIEIPF